MSLCPTISLSGYGLPVLRISGGWVAFGEDSAAAAVEKSAARAGRAASRAGGGRARSGRHHRRNRGHRQGVCGRGHRRFAVVVRAESGNPKPKVKL